MSFSEHAQPGALPASPPSSPPLATRSPPAFCSFLSLNKQEILKPGPCASGSAKRRRRRRQSAGCAPRGICDPAPPPRPTRARTHTPALTYTHTRTNTHSYTPAPRARRLALPRRRNAAEPGERVSGRRVNAPRSRQPDGPVGRAGGRSSTRGEWGAATAGGSRTPRRGGAGRLRAGRGGAGGPNPACGFPGADEGSARAVQGERAIPGRVASCEVSDGPSRKLPPPCS